MASRALRLGWTAAVLLGQHICRASGTSTCSSVVVSGVDDLDGTYDLVDNSDSSYSRAGGNALYELYRSSTGDADVWYFSVTNTVVYRTIDPSLHPADITLDWATCTSILSCNGNPALKQPVITCEDAASTPEPAPSTCTSVIVSGVDDLDGSYDLVENSGFAYSRAGGNALYELYKSSTGDADVWYFSVTNTVVYRTIDFSGHPADITLDWATCTSILSCSGEPALRQPMITCEGETVAPTPSPTPGIPDATASTSDSPTIAATPSTSDETSSPTPSATVAVNSTTPDATASPSASPAITATPSTSDETPSPTPSATVAVNSTIPDATPSPSPPPTIAATPSTPDETPSPNPPPATAEADTEGDTDDDDEDSDDISATEVVTGVLATLIGAAILGAVGYAFRKRSRETTGS
ncbi:unnamed protein product [Scytosiphon promiscuus]